jgi:hypothetical protein
MGYLGYKPADKPLTAADITDSIITSAKITDATIVNADINSSAAIALTKLASTGTLTVDNIQFPATQVASANANNLDDYEQGTYTPSYSTSGGGQSVTTNIQSGQYTKIGNCVYFQLMIRSSSFTGGSGVIRIDLPFAASSSLQMVVYTGEAAGWTTNCPDKAYIGQSASHLILQRVSGTATVDITTSNITASGSNNLINCGGFYYAA